MTKFSDVPAAGVTIRESANDGSDFTNPAADYRRLFLGEDGQLHVKDSAGTVTDIGSSSGIPATLLDAKGDLIVASAADTAARLAVGGTNGHVLTVDSGEATGMKWAAVAAGGGLIDFDQTRNTAGNKTLNSTTWANLDTGMDLTLTATTGDVCEVTLLGLYENQNVGAYIDCMTLVSAAGVSWFGSGEPTTSTGNGVIGWSKPVAATTYQAFGASVAIVLAAGDISGGTVTLRLRYRTGAAANITLRAASTDPLIFQAKVLRV